jgi:hypothetical protein
VVGKKSPSLIAVFDKQIGRSRAQTHTYVKYCQLESFKWASGPDYSTLTLIRHKGQPMVIGVPPAISRQALTAFLIERNVRQQTDA